MDVVGTVVELTRYPVKSMRGEPLRAAELTFQGIPDDRRFAFVQAGFRSSFPWLTAREVPEMLLYQPTVEPNGPGPAEVTVTTPAGEKWPVQDNALRLELEQRFGRPVYLLQNWRGSYDAAPVSLISRQTAARIAEESATMSDHRRFRPNLVVDLKGNASTELDWVGKVVRIGDTARVAITEPDRRCVIITLDPDSGSASPAVLRTVAQKHAKCAGVYGAVITCGEVRPGDNVWVEN